MRILKKVLSVVLVVSLLFSITPSVVLIAHAYDRDIVLGPVVIEGGKRDMLWPVPSAHNLQSCFYDNKGNRKALHMAIDISSLYGGEGDDIVAVYDGWIEKVYDIGKYYHDGSYGNFVIMRHEYKTSDGKTITLYSKYNHMLQVDAEIKALEGKTGETGKIKAGRRLGGIGNTGSSDGNHLDFQIFYGSYTNINNSIDPFSNQLLDMPDDLMVRDSWACGDLYYNAIKAIYAVPLCSHDKFTDLGVCVKCKMVFDWASTYETGSAGIYKVTKLSGIYLSKDAPYEASTDKSENRIGWGKEVEVLGSVINAVGTGQFVWYKVSYKGEVGYTYAGYLKFESHSPQNIYVKEKSFAPAGGATIRKVAQNLEGKVISTYPLKRIVAYLDGDPFVTWDAPDKNTYELELKKSDIDYALDFGGLPSGKHTIELKAVDIHRDELTTIHKSYFYTETSTPEPVYYTVILNANRGNCDTANISVKENTAIGSIPVATRTGYIFNGWYTAAVGGSRISADTVFTSGKTIYAHWLPIYYTVSYDTQTDSDIVYGNVSVQHGYTLEKLPIPSQSGYSFQGWYTDPTGGTQITDQTEITSNMTLYAHWSAVSVKVSFDANGGSVSIREKTVTYKQTYGELPIPTRSGYTFTGWVYDGGINYSRRISSDSIVESYYGHTLIAQWKETVYKVTGGNIYFDNATGTITGADSSITAADIPETIDGVAVKVIADGAFQECRQMTDIKLPDTLTTIGNKAFRCCIQLAAIELPGSLITIGEGAFQECAQLTNIYIPASVTKIGDHAFYDCRFLNSVNVDINNNVYSSVDGVLMDESGTRIIYCPTRLVVEDRYIIPSGVKEIMAHAFYDVTSIPYITVPKSVTSIDATSFKNSAIDVEEGNLYYSSIDGVLFNKNQEVLLHYPKMRTGSYSVPESVTEIGEDAFCNGKITSVYMSYNVRTIGKSAFSGCLRLKSVLLPESLVEIGEYAFWNNSALSEMSIPGKVQIIGDKAFDLCSNLTTVYFQGNAPQIGEYAFGDFYSGKKDVTLCYRGWTSGWSSPNYSGYSTVVWESRYAVANGYIYYNTMEGTIVACDCTEPDLVIPESINGIQIVGIDAYAFSECTKIKCVTLPQSLKNVSGLAFSGSNIERVNYQGTVAQWLEGRETTSYVFNGTSIQCSDKTLPVDLAHVGLCENDILWYLSKEGTLTIDGAGAIVDFASGTAPWGSFQSFVKEIVICNGITRIGSYSFCNLRAKKISIPNSCNSIGDKAFMGCSSLETVIIPDGMTEIGREAFCGCSALTEITLPTSVTTIGYRAFNGSADNTIVYYTGTTEQWNAMVKNYLPSYFDKGVQLYCDGIKLPENTIYMGTAGEDIEWFLSVEGTLTITGTGPMVSNYEIRVDLPSGDWYVDNGCSWAHHRSLIVNVVIEEGITSVSRNAFLQHEMLESVTIPSTATKIEEAAFDGCVKLQRVDIENGVTSIGASAFAGCSNLKSVNIPGSVSSLGNSVFAGCTGLTKVSFAGESLTALPAYAFGRCESLQTVDLPDSLIDLGYESFYGCKSLKILCIPRLVENFTLANIGSDTGIEAFSVDSANKYFSSVDGVLFDKAVTTLYLYPQERTAEAYYMPETVSAIAEEAFVGNTYLKTVTVPAGIYEIGDRAFLECTSLTGVYFAGQAPHYEGENVFKKYVAGNYTQYENLPNIVIYYREDAFYEGWSTNPYREYNKSTWEFIVLEYSVTGGKVYFETISGRIVDADASITAAVIPSQIDGWYVTSIGEGAFAYCSDLANITLPRTVTKIEESAFSGCSSLISVTIPEGVNEIPNWAFSYCRKLASIAIPSSVKTIQYAAFEDCESLNHILYGGTTEEWVQISIVEEDSDYFPENNDDLINARTLHYEATSVELYAKESCTYSGMCCSLCDEFVYGSQLDSDEHDFQDFVCTRCDAPQVLRYTLKENGEAVVEGIGVHWYGIEIEVPSHIEGCRVVEIADNAFVQDPIRNIVIPDTVETIGSSAFLWCNSLENVIIGSGLKSMNMPGSVFDSCEKLKGIWVDPDNQYFSSDDYGVLFNKDHSALIKYPNAGPAVYTVPNEVITIGQSAFSESSNLEVIYIGRGVTVIELSAFSNCKKLKEAHLNEALSTIENYAFYQCDSLSDVYYGGTADRWDNISIGAENSGLLSAKLHIAEPVIMVNNNGVILEFTSIVDAIDQAPAGAVLQLIGDVEENVVVFKNIVLDLNGFDIVGSVGVTSNARVTVRDSQTDDYTIEDSNGYGKITGTVTGVQAEDGYIMITEPDGVSFHRINLQLTAMTLRASAAGVYYKGNFAGDEIVAQYVDCYGVALSVTGEPSADAPGICSWYDSFTPGNGGNAANGTLLYGVMKTTNTNSVNAENAEMAIYGRAYILTKDGQYVFGECVSRSFRKQVELVDDQWNDLNAEQQLAVLDMYQSYKAIMSQWEIPNILESAQ